MLSTVDGTLQHVNADSGIGPVLVPGTAIFWTYEVTNVSVGSAETSNPPLQITRIGDDFGTAADRSDDFVPVYVSGDTNGERPARPGRDVGLHVGGRRRLRGEPGLHTNTVTVEGRAANGGACCTADTAENRHAGSTGPITIRKAINGDEADAPTGPVLEVGAPITWTYRVTTTSTTPLANVVVLDDNGSRGFAGDDFTPTYESGDTNGNSLLELGEMWLYRAFGTATEGQYRNVGSVTAVLNGTTIADDDLAHYLGTSGIRIDKRANGEEADSAPGVEGPAGAPLVYTYLVHGESAVPLAGVTVHDDNGTPLNAADDFFAVYVSGDADSDGLLDFKETWLFTSAGVLGARTTMPPDTVKNIATASATRAGQPVSDTDEAYVTGRPAELKLVKAVNALDPANPQGFEDANSAPGRIVVVGTTVVFTYAVSTDGLSPVRDVTVTDNRIAAIVQVTTPDGFNVGDIDRDRLLDPGEIWIFRGIETALQGLQTNIGTATGVDVSSGATLTDTDPANYTAGTVPPPVTIVKAVNAVSPASPTPAEDANDWRNPFLVKLGDPVVYTYVVRSTVALGNVVVVDDNGTPDNPADDFAPTFVSGDNNGNGVLNQNETWLYRVTRTAALGLHTNVARVSGTAGGTTHRDDDPASVFGWFVEVEVRKATNAADPWNPTAEEDADAAPGQILLVGTPVVWTYLVTNTGNIALTVALRDDAGTLAPGDDFTPAVVDGDVNGNGRLDPEETWLYTSTGVRPYNAQLGQYVNVATLTTTPPDGTTLTKRARSFHLGVDVPLDLVKAIDPDDPFEPSSYENADFEPGVILPVGSQITWSYLLRNTGTQALSVIGIQDDGGVAGSVAFAPDPVLDAQGFNVGDSDHDGLLDPGEAWLFRSGVHTVALGPYRNTATAFATFHGVTPVVQVTASNVANLRGTPVEGIEITKAVNGSPADTAADALYVKAGDMVTWTYVVTSTTVTPIANVVVTDDAGSPGLPGDDFSPTFTGGDINGNGLLDPDETWTYVASGVMAAGPYLNVARARGSAGGILVEADDIAHAFGSAPAVSIAKAVNAVNPLAPTEIEDANGPLTPELFATGTAVFTYLVRNTGNIRVRVDKVTGIVDDHGTPAFADDDFSPGYVSGDTNDDGWLDLSETWLFRSVTFTVQPASYTNTGTVTGTEPRTSQTVTSSDIARYFGRTGAEGNTPGFWKTNVDTKNAIAWPRLADGTLVLDPLQPISSLFAGLPPVYADLTLDQGLGTGGGGIEALLRHAIAGVLNATHPWVAYPVSAGRGDRARERRDRVWEPDDDRVAQGSVRGLQRARVRPRRERERPGAEAVGARRLGRGGERWQLDGARDDRAVRPGARPGERRLGDGQRQRLGRQRLPRSLGRRHLRCGRERQDGRDHDRRRHEQRGQRDVHCPAQQRRRRGCRPRLGVGHDPERRRAAERHGRCHGCVRRRDGWEHDHVHSHAFGQHDGRADAEPPVGRLGDVRRRLHGDAVGRHPRCERLDADAGRRPDLGDADGECCRRRDRRGGRDGRSDRPRRVRLHRRFTGGGHRLDRRQRRAAALDRRSDGDRRRCQHDDRDRDGAAVGAGSDGGDGDGDDGGRDCTRRQRLPGEDRDRDLRRRSDDGELHGQHRQQPHCGADRVLHDRPLERRRRHDRRWHRGRHDRRQRLRARRTTGGAQRVGGSGARARGDLCGARLGPGLLGWGRH